MTDRLELIKKADDLKAQAEREPESSIRDRLTHMADTYIHLAESGAWTEAHPADAARLSDVLTNRG